MTWMTGSPAATYQLAVKPTTIFLRGPRQAVAPPRPDIRVDRAPAHGRRSPACPAATSRASRARPTWSTSAEAATGSDGRRRWRKGRGCWSTRCGRSWWRQRRNGRRLTASGRRSMTCSLSRSPTMTIWENITWTASTASTTSFNGSSPRRSFLSDEDSSTQNNTSNTYYWVPCQTKWLIYTYMPARCRCRNDGQQIVFRLFNPLKCSVIRWLHLCECSVPSRSKLQL